MLLFCMIGLIDLFLIISRSLSEVTNIGSEECPYMPVEPLSSFEMDDLDKVKQHYPHELEVAPLQMKTIRLKRV